MTIDQIPLGPQGFLERSSVPLWFPQFRNSAALAHLAHMSRGPRYVLVGGKAWYDPEDIRSWLELNKQCGPKRATLPSKSDSVQATKNSAQKKRGRPTKLEQAKRRVGSAPVALPTLSAT